MKIKNTLALALLALGTTALLASAQDNSNDGPPGSDSKASERGGPGQHEPGPSAGGRSGQRQGPALVGALDANHDRVIDAEEIANASAALKGLDKNGDGKLTPEEFMGARPSGKPPGENQGGGKNNAGPGNNDRPPGPPPGDQ